MISIDTSKELFATLFDSSPAACAVSTVYEGRFVLVNKAFEKLTGYKKDNIIGRTSTEIGVWALPEQRSKIIEIIINDDCIENYEMQLKDSTGNIRYCLFSAQQIEYDSKPHILSQTVDITESKLAEETLKESVKKYQDLYDNAPDMFVSVDAKTTKIIECNNTVSLKTGYSKDEIIGLDVAEMYHPDCEEKRQEIIQQFLTTGEVYNAELILKRKDGKKIDVLLNASAVRDEHGKILYSRSSWRDITKHKEIENKLAKRSHDIGERVKELNCLYAISKLLVEPDNTLEEIYASTVNMIPPSWQYQEITCARIIIGDKTYMTSNFLETPWRQSSDITARGKKVGEVEVYHLEEKEQKHEGPFVKEERALINGIAKLLGVAFERKKAEEKLLLLKKAVETIEVGVTITDEKGIITYTNPAEARMHGYYVNNLINRHARIFAPKKQKRLESKIGINSMEHWKRESLNVRKDSSIFPVQLTSTAVRDENGNPIAVITVSDDITERKHLEEQLKQLATTDPLTGCYNRRYFFELGEREFQRSMRYGSPLSALMLDIDHFKKINDTYGHPIGDRALIAMTETCLSTLRKSDIFGRIGGEEFAIIFVEADLEKAVRLAERIRKYVLKITIQAEPELVSFTVSIGVSASVRDDTSLEEILKRSDDALYRAKKAGRNRVMAL
jgi:diguanylate cyclase (GGDEF)-like protein/PAS domain S-box-containing protein